MSTKHQLAKLPPLIFCISFLRSLRSLRLIFPLLPIPLDLAAARPSEQLPIFLFLDQLSC